jgi:hypothetical protein
MKTTNGADTGRGPMKCHSCLEQNGQYTLTLTDLRDEILDCVVLCLDCLTTSRVLDVVTPGSIG